MGIVMHGGQTVNYGWLDRRVQSEAEINATKSSDVSLAWTYSTGLLAKFDNNLIGGSVNLSDVLTGWKIYRCNISKNDNIYHYVGEVDVDVDTIRDYMVASGNTYKYMILPVTASYIGDVIYSNEITLDFDCWSLVDTVTNEVWLFKLSFDGAEVEGNYTVNSNVAVVMNNSEFPVVSYGKQCYLTNTLTALIGNENTNTGAYEGDSSINRDNLIAFLNNGHEKIYKNIKGDLKVVNTYADSFKTYNQYVELPQTITFNIVESNSPDSMQIFEVVE